MPALRLGGVVVPVAYSTPVEERPGEVGDRAESLNGTPLSTVRAYTTTIGITTTRMPRADADALRARIRTIPNTCDGDIPGGTFNCHPKLTARQILPQGRVVTVFELRLL